jgi:hypothetical protein
MFKKPKNRNGFAALMLCFTVIFASFPLVCCSGVMQGSTVATPPVINSAIAGEFSVDYSGEKFKCSISNQTSGIITMTYTKPEDIAGLTYTLADGQISTTYRGLKVIMPSATLPKGAVAQCLFNALAALKQNPQPECTKAAEDEFVFVQNSDSGRFNLTANSAGNIVKIEFADVPLVFEKAQ